MNDLTFFKQKALSDAVANLYQCATRLDAQRYIINPGQLLNIVIDAAKQAGLTDNVIQQLVDNIKCQWQTLEITESEGFGARQ